MQKKGVIIGILIGIVIVTGPMGALATIDKLNGPEIHEVAVERLNSTHAAVSWSTKEPTHGHLVIYTQFQCNNSWYVINDINDVNDSSLSRTHLIVAPIYELNSSQVNQTIANASANASIKQYEGVSPKRYQVDASVYSNGSGAYKTIVERNLSQACQ